MRSTLDALMLSLRVSEEEANRMLASFMQRYPSIAAGWVRLRVIDVIQDEVVWEATSVEA